MTTFPGTVLLVMDFEQDIVKMTAGGGSAAAVAKAAQAVAAARRSSIPVIYVVVAYRPGHVDASADNKRVAMLRAKGMLVEGTAGAGIVAELAPAAGEPIVVKRRVSALAHTDLAPLLSALHARTLVLAGLSTSGVVLSTLRQAADSDYRIIVLEDACADPDQVAHKALMTAIFPPQAEVVLTQRFVDAATSAAADGAAFAPTLRLASN
jgi:nicotinamidase-related amidase